MGLVGETGCGKSVTALSILQLIRPPGEIEGGQVLFTHKDKYNHEVETDLTQSSYGEIREFRGNNITMIFQDPLNSLNPVIKIGDQLAEVYLLHQKEFLEQELLDTIKERENFLTQLEILIEEKNAMKQEIAKLSQEVKILSKKGTCIQEQAELDKLKNIFTNVQNKIIFLKRRTKKNLTLKDVAWHQAADIIKEVGIADAERIVNQYPHELSGGMRQRIMISMGLACHSQLLIADEPTTALDVTIQAQILDLIRTLKKNLHNSVLLITHSLGVIYELCDNVAVMYAGNIVEFGKVKQVLQEPLHPYTQGLLNAIPKVIYSERKNKLKTIPGLVPNLIEVPPGCKFTPRCPYAMKICQQIYPRFIEAQNGISVACHLYDEEINNPENTKDYEKVTKTTQEELV